MIPKHPSMRGSFCYHLYYAMELNPNIIVLTGDLGYLMFDYIRRDFPDRFINCKASEQAMLDIAVGLSYKGKIPFVYSITPFLLYRGFETIRTYIDHENLNVKLLGGGRDLDYSHDGYSHNAEDVKKYLLPMKNIKQLFPADNSELEGLLGKMINSTSPYFISLKR